MDDRAFERCVRRAVEGLPDRFRDALDNIEIVIEDFADERGQDGKDPVPHEATGQTRFGAGDSGNGRRDRILALAGGPQGVDVGLGRGGWG